jgi:large subunit ribosomal protein L4
MVKVKTYVGGKVQETEVDSSLFGDRILGRTLKDAVVMYEANRRAGTAKAKTRSEVNGPNHKLWPQKHTGRARMGSTKSPLWRGGGVIFGPVPRDYSYHMPVKARRVALYNALYAKLQDGEVLIADGWPAEKPSTKQAFGILKALGAEGSALVVTAAPDKNLWRSLRNVPLVDVRAVADLNAREVLLRKHMIVTKEALAMLQERAAGAKKKPERKEAVRT